MLPFLMRTTVKRIRVWPWVPRNNLPAWACPRPRGRSPLGVITLLSLMGITICRDKTLIALTCSLIAVTTYGLTAILITGLIAIFTVLIVIFISGLFISGLIATCSPSFFAVSWHSLFFHSSYSPYLELYW